METLVETLETQWKHNPIAKPQLLHRCRVHTHVAAHAAPAVRTHMPQSGALCAHRVRRTATRRVRGWSDRFRLRGRGTYCHVHVTCGLGLARVLVYYMIVWLAG